jgi:hypothetical protein
LILPSYKFIDAIKMFLRLPKSNFTEINSFLITRVSCKAFLSQMPEAVGPSVKWLSPVWYQASEKCCFWGVGMGPQRSVVFGMLGWGLFSSPLSRSSSNAETIQSEKC